MAVLQPDMTRPLHVYRNLEQKQVTSWDDASCPQKMHGECRPHLIGVRDSFQVWNPYILLARLGN